MSEDQEKRKINWNNVFKVVAKIILFNGLAIVFMLIGYIYFDKLKIPGPEIFEVFFSVFGVIYAIVIGLLMIEVIQRYHNLNSIVSQEINTLQDIRDFLLYLDNNHTARKKILESLLVYVKWVISKEWPNMKSKTKLKSKKQIDSDTSKHLVELIKAVHEIDVDNNISDIIALKSIMDKVAKVTTYRTDRLELSEEHISLPLRLFIIFMSAVVIGMISLMLIECILPMVSILMVCASVTAICGLYLFIIDLNRPFGGFWDISDRQFVNLRINLEKTLNDLDG